MSSLSPSKKVARHVSLSGVDFAPVTTDSGGHNGKDGTPGGGGGETFQYHSDVGGSCWGGGAPPIVVVICCGERFYDRTETSASTTARTSSIFDDDEDHAGRNDFGPSNETCLDVRSKTEVKVYLSNAGVCLLTRSDLDRLSAKTDGDGEWFDVTGTNYPSAPHNFKCQLRVRVKEVCSKGLGSELMMQGLKERIEIVRGDGRPVKEKFFDGVSGVKNSDAARFFIVAMLVVPKFLLDKFGGGGGGGGGGGSCENVDAAGDNNSGGGLFSYFSTPETIVSASTSSISSTLPHLLVSQLIPLTSILLSSFFLLFSFLFNKPKKYV